MGALKLAETAAATAHPSKSLFETVSIWTLLQTQPEITAAR